MREMGIDPTLENRADQLLKRGARQAGVIRANGRGFTAWAVEHGILTKKHQEKIRQLEVTGLDMEHSMRPIGEKHSKKEEESG